MEAEIWVVVDNEGSYVAGTDESALADLCQENSIQTCCRTIKLTLKLPLPTPICVDVELPAESSECTIKVS